MSLQTVLTTRRKFLERSVQGAGSLLLSSLLLQSCIKDHNFPDPTDPPSLFIPDIDWNDDAKILVTSAIEMIPEAGDLLGGLLDILWPDSKEKPKDVWGEIKEQVEAIVDQKIADNVYLQVSDDLSGLKNNITLYLKEINAYTESLKTNPQADTNDLRIQWIVTRNMFENARPHFQTAGYELPLIGLFTQFANLYLSLLRDGVAFGKSWGRTDADHQQDSSDLTQSISDFRNYVIEKINSHRDSLQQNTPTNHLKMEPFKTVNAFIRQMHLKVLDFESTWRNFDVSVFPHGEKVFYTRELYSDPYGSSIAPGPIVPFKAPSKFPLEINIWGIAGMAWANREMIWGVEQTYPTGEGPNENPANNIYINEKRGIGDNTFPNGGSFFLTQDNPIVAVKVGYDDHVLLSMQFWFSNGTDTGRLGAIIPNYYSGQISFPNEALSGIYGQGSWPTNGGGYSYFVFGFKHWEWPSTKLNAIRTLYKTSSKERSVADFAKFFPTLAIPEGLITDELKAARQAHWASIKAHK